LDLSEGLTIPHCKKKLAPYEIIAQGLEIARKVDMRFGTWNIRSLCTVDSLKTEQENSQSIRMRVVFSRQTITHFSTEIEC